MIRFLLITILFLFGASIEGKERTVRPPLSSIQLVDRNGFSETISDKDRLYPYEKVNFFSNLPYQKVLRVYQPSKDGTIRSFLTTYYENGQIKQYLEIRNARAYGIYQEWYPDGNLKLRTHVVGGIADISEAAQSQWLFDKVSCAYNEEGQITAKFSYKKGVLEGPTETFYPGEKLKSRTFYKNNLIEGVSFSFNQEGDLIESRCYKEGLLDGVSEIYWSKERLASREIYQKGLLESGIYYSKQGEVISRVERGEGCRIQVGEGFLRAKQEISRGEIKGKVTLYNESGFPYSTYHVRDSELNGLETLFFDHGKPQLEIDWCDGKIQGKVISWYRSGAKESEREIIKNQRQGLSIAWYPSGDLMLIEEYEKDLLVKGDYFKKGEKSPISKVEEYQGIATLFDEDGVLREKIHYEKGKPTPF